MSRLPNQIPFVAARHFKEIPAGRKVRLIVVHTMEAAEKGETAESCARYFQTVEKPVSAHYCLDNNSVVQCVQTKDIAYCAPGANKDGIHLEHAGFARQTVSEWLDAYSKAMLELSAELVGRILLPKFDIPCQWLSPADIKAGQKGITSHWNITKAYPELGGSHTDPGPYFPVALYLDMVRKIQGVKS